MSTQLKISMAILFISSLLVAVGTFQYKENLRTVRQFQSLADENVPALILLNEIQLKLFVKGLLKKQRRKDNGTPVGYHVKDLLKH